MSEVLEAQTHAVSEEHIRIYQRDGAVLIKGAVSRDNLELLERGLEEVYSKPGGRFSRVRDLDGKGETLVDQFPSLYSPSLRQIVEQSGAAELAGRLMRCDSAHFVLDQIFYKQKGRVVPTPWHQDTPFLRVRGYDMARVWMTCDPSPSELTVQVVRGSHRWNVVYNAISDRKSEVATADEGREFSYDGIHDASLPFAPDVEAHRDSFDILSWDVEPGDALIFNGNMLHGASGCLDHPTPRRAFTTMWGGPDLKYHTPRGQSVPSLAEINNITVPHGARIGDYPIGFPVGWRR